MELKTGDSVIFIGNNNNNSGWELEFGKEYIIINRAFNNTGENFISVTRDNTHSDIINWFPEDDFITIEKARYYKLKQIDESRR